MRSNRITTLLLYVSLLITINAANGKSLYVGDNNSTAILKKGGEKIIGIFFTNKHCKDCRSFEEEYSLIASTIEKEFKMDVYRCELSSNPHLQ